MDQSDKSDLWSSETTSRIRMNIKEERTRQGLSAQALSLRCSSLGYPIARGTFAKWDKGHRQNITIPELIIVARALTVPAIDLLYSPYHSGRRIETAPGESTTENQARRTFTEAPRSGDPLESNTVRTLLDGYLSTVEHLDRQLYSAGKTEDYDEWVELISDPYISRIVQTIEAQKQTLLSFGVLLPETPVHLQAFIDGRVGNATPVDLPPDQGSGQ